MHGGQLSDGMADELESVTPAGRELAGAVLEAFTRHRLVGIGESHGLQNHQDALQMLLTDPRLPAALDDIVAESGNARYQGFAVRGAQNICSRRLAFADRRCRDQHASGADYSIYLLECGTCCRPWPVTKCRWILCSRAVPPNRYARRTGLLDRLQ